MEVVHESGITSSSGKRELKGKENIYSARERDASSDAQQTLSEEVNPAY
jgi:hypothetical protein